MVGGVSKKLIDFLAVDRQVGKFSQSRNRGGGWQWYRALAVPHEKAALKDVERGLEASSSLNCLKSEHWRRSSFLWSQYLPRVVILRLARFLAALAN